MNTSWMILGMVVVGIFMIRGYRAFRYWQGVRKFSRELRTAVAAACRVKEALIRVHVIRSEKAVIDILISLTADEIRTLVSRLTAIMPRYMETTVRIDPDDVAAA